MATVRWCPPPSPVMRTRVLSPVRSRVLSPVRHRLLSYVAPPPQVVVVQRCHREAPARRPCYPVMFSGSAVVPAGSAAVRLTSAGRTVSVAVDPTFRPEKAHKSTSTTCKEESFEDGRSSLSTQATLNDICEPQSSDRCEELRKVFAQLVEKDQELREQSARMRELQEDRSALEQLQCEHKVLILDFQEQNKNLAKLEIRLRQEELHSGRSRTPAEFLAKVKEECALESENSRLRAQLERSLQQLADTNQAISDQTLIISDLQEALSQKEAVIATQQQTIKRLTKTRAQRAPAAA